MSIQPATPPEPTASNGNRYGNAFLSSDAPDHRLPAVGMPADDAMRLLGEEIVLDGIPMRNLATFVTTWMEPQAQRVIADNLHRNYIDHAEYPQTAEIEQRCIRMLADLFHAPGETTGDAHAGLVGGDHARRAVAEVEVARSAARRRARRRTARTSCSAATSTWCGRSSAATSTSSRASSRCRADKFTIGPEDVEPHVDENTIGVAAVLGTTFTGHADDIVGIDALLARLRDERGLEVPLHIDGASGGFVWPFLYPDSAWDFRLEHVRSINVSATSTASSTRASAG